MTLNFSNVLSLSRALFAFAFLQENAMIRVLAIALAMLSDFLDGYLARRQKTASQFGAILDPIMDKIFRLLCWRRLLFGREVDDPGAICSSFERHLSLPLWPLFRHCKKLEGYVCKCNLVG